MSMRWTEQEYQAHLEKKGKATARTKPEKRAKYNNKKTWVDGVCFDSQKESQYYGQLKLLMQAKAIKGFCLQPQFILVEGNEAERAITYKADFIVFHNDGHTEIVDVKGFESAQWKRTFKQFRLKYPELKLEIEK